MKTTKTKYFFLLASAMVLALFTTSCGGDDDPIVEPDPVIADFDWALQEGSDSVVVFTNKSLNATSYSWNFGDGSAASTEENPVHTFRTGTAFTVTLTATGEGGTDDASETLDEFVNPIDPNAPIQILSGGSSKTWVLAPILNGYWFGALDNTDVANKWWGTDASHAESRACLFNDEFTFSVDGDYTRNFAGDFWKEYLYFNACGEPTAEGCLDVTSETTLTNKLGADVSAWLNTDFTFSIDGNNVITVTGEGGYIGHYTSGRDTRDFGVVSEYKYTIVSISADQLVISGLGNTGDSNEDATCLGYEAGGLDTEGPAHALFTMTFVPKP